MPILKRSARNLTSSRILSIIDVHLCEILDSGFSWHPVVCWSWGELELAIHASDLFWWELWKWARDFSWFWSGTRMGGSADCQQIGNTIFHQSLPRWRDYGAVKETIVHSWRSAHTAHRLQLPLRHMPEPYNILRECYSVPAALLNCVRCLNKVSEKRGASCNPYPWKSYHSMARR